MWRAAGCYVKACDIRPHDDGGRTFSLANSHSSCQSDEYWWSYML